MGVTKTSTTSVTSTSVTSTSVTSTSPLDHVLKELKLVVYAPAIKECAFTLEELPLITKSDLRSEKLKNKKLGNAAAHLVVAKLQKLKNKRIMMKFQESRKAERNKTGKQDSLKRVSSLINSNQLA